MTSASSSAFYGSQNKKDKTRLALALRLRRAEAEVASNTNPCLRPCAARTALAAKHRLSAAKAAMSQQVVAFHTQEAALQWASSASLSVFARELDSSGRRCFLSCHPEVMFDIVMARKVQHRSAN